LFFCEEEKNVDEEERVCEGDGGKKTLTRKMSSLKRIN
jgi:hypothetical protein